MCYYVKLVRMEDLQEELEDMRLGEEEEEETVSVRNDAVTVFRGHSGWYWARECVWKLTHNPLPPFMTAGSVFSVSLSPDSSLACSGGEDDKAFLWRTSDAAVMMEIKGHMHTHVHTIHTHISTHTHTRP